MNAVILTDLARDHHFESRPRNKGRPERLWRKAMVGYPGARFREFATAVHQLSPEGVWQFPGRPWPPCFEGTA